MDVKLTILPLVLGLGAVLVLAVGLFAAVEAALVVRTWVGSEYELWVFCGALVAVVTVAAALYWWQDAVLGWLAPLVGRAAPEIMYCQTCGAPSRHDVSFCPQCAGTRFGIAKPDAAGRTGQWHVQVGMEVLTSDGRAVGVIKRKRSDDFLVARPLKRDIYLPVAAIARTDRTTVHLSVSAIDPAGS